MCGACARACRLGSRRADDAANAVAGIAVLAESVYNFAPSGF